MDGETEVNTGGGGDKNLGSLRGGKQLVIYAPAFIVKEGSKHIRNTTIVINHKCSFEGDFSLRIRKSDL